MSTTSHQPGGELELREERPLAVPAPAGEVAPAGRGDVERPTAVHLVGRIVARRGELVAHLRESDRAKRAGGRVKALPRQALRSGWAVAQGGRSWWVRAGQGLTHGYTREQIRLARLEGNREALGEWKDRLRDEKDHRAERLQELPTTLLAVTQAVGIALGLLVAFLLVGGVAAWAWPGGAGWADWWGGVLGIAETAWTVAVALLSVAPWVGVPSLLVALYREGRRAANPPRWLLAPGEQTDELPIDERAISAALQHLGIAPLTTFFKAGGQLQYVVPARRDGDGTHARVRLPLGVTAEMVAAQRPKLAGNLGRATLETWPTTWDEASLLDLWVADRGKLGGGAGEWPLQADGECDVFAGVPFGVSQRGAVILAPLFETNWLIGGRPGQGKSAAMRTLLLGAALDPTCELWVFVMGESPDFKPFGPRLGRYAMGMDDRVAAAALGALRDALAEMERRGKVLGQQPGSPPKTSRKLANLRELGLHPLVLSIDECHELFMHPKYGKEAAELAVRLIKRGRKYGIILVLATQSPTKDSIPREVTRNVGVGVAFAVSDHVANDGLLGAGKYKAGIRATDLRMKVDRGTCVAVGLTDQTFELVRTFYIAYEDGRDDVTPVIARAMQAWQPRTLIADPNVQDAELVPDHLVDILAALRSEQRVRTQLVLGRLAERDPATYEGWTPGDLKRVLVEHDAEPTKSHGHMVVHLEAVEQALRDRDV